MPIGRALVSIILGTVGLVCTIVISHGRANGAVHLRHDGRVEASHASDEPHARPPPPPPRLAAPLVTVRCRAPLLGGLNLSLALPALLALLT